jgi:hypothetical protein
MNSVRYSSPSHDSGVGSTGNAYNNLVGKCNIIHIPGIKIILQSLHPTTSWQLDTKVYNYIVNLFHVSAFFAIFRGVYEYLPEDGRNI